MNDNFLVDGTNFKIASGIYDVIYNDCIYFGYIKNDKPNISGFLNHIIHHLSQYREDLHEQFLKNNNYDSNLVLLIENNIYNTYLKTFDISNDAKHKIQLRINKEHLETFINIVDKYLHKYNLDFTKYIRTLLLEYAIKPLYQREYFSIYIYSKIILKALKNSQFIKVRTIDGENVRLVPIAIENDYLQNQSYLFGYTQNKENIAIIKYSNIKAVTILDEYMGIEESDYDKLIETSNEFFEELASDKGGENVWDEEI